MGVSLGCIEGEFVAAAVDALSHNFCSPPLYSTQSPQPHFGHGAQYVPAKIVLGIAAPE